MLRLKDLRGGESEWGIRLANTQHRVPDWEFWVHTRQFSQEWQTKDLEDTELGRVRNRLKTKDGIGGSLCAIRLQERKKTRRKDIEEVRGTAWRANIVVGQKRIFLT